MTILFAINKAPQKKTVCLSFTSFFQEGVGRSFLYLSLYFPSNESDFFSSFYSFLQLKKKKKIKHTHTQNLGRLGKLFKKTFQSGEISVGRSGKRFRSSEILIGRLEKLWKKRFRSGEISSVGKTLLKLFTLFYRATKHSRSLEDKQTIFVCFCLAWCCSLEMFLQQIIEKCVIL